MAKICIIEDDENDVIDRYGRLASSPHEIFVVFDLRLEEKPFRRRKLTDEGFTNEKVTWGLEQIPSADLYLCDGLRGQCFRLADKLGKQRTYINSDSQQILNEAQEREYLLLRNLDEVIASLE